MVRQHCLTLATANTIQVRFGLSGDKRFSAEGSKFKYKDMYYAIVKFVKVWPNRKINQLLAKWDRWDILVSLYVYPADCL